MTPVNFSFFSYFDLEASKVIFLYYNHHDNMIRRLMFLCHIICILALRNQSHNHYIDNGGTCKSSFMVFSWAILVYLHQLMVDLKCYVVFGPIQLFLRQVKLFVLFPLLDFHQMGQF